MIKAVAIVLIAVGLSAAAAAAVIHEAGPSTVDLDKDIAAVNAEITASDAEAARYSGGAILAEVKLRSSILKNTLAMLEQKRASFLRGISLRYVEPTARTASIDDDVTVSSGLQKAIEDARSARAEAAKYAGGLVQAIALLREQAALTTEVMIRQRIALHKLGVPLPVLPQLLPMPPSLPGKPASDKDVLQ